MGVPFLNYDPTSGEAPPQAPQPVGTLADLAITPAATPTQDLRASAFGDEGAAQYENLVAAGQRRPSAGLGGVAGMPAASPTQPTSAGVQPSDFMQLFGDVAAGAAGHPEAGQERALNQARLQAQQQSQQLQLEKEVRENASEFYEHLMPSIFAAFPGRPDLAAGMLKNAAAQRNLVVDPTVLIGLNQRMQDGQMSRESVHKIISDPNTPIGVIARIGASAKGADEAVQATAMADKAISDAKTAKETAEAAPEKIEAERKKAAIDVAIKLRTAGRVPSNADFATLDADGKTAIEVPIPGVEGGSTWRVIPKDQAPKGTPDVAGNLRRAKAKEAGVMAGAKQEASFTANTRKMIETAPKVIDFLNDIENDLKTITTGPAIGRWRQFAQGQIGAKDPDFAGLQSNLGLLTTLTAQMHVGARQSDAMLKHFEDIIGTAKQSPENLRASLEKIRRYADRIQHMKVGKEFDWRSAAEASPTDDTPAPGGDVSAEDFLNQ